MGVTFHTVNNQEYILFSRSYGRDTPSILQVFRYDNDIKVYGKTAVFKTGIEVNKQLKELLAGKKVTNV